MASIDASIDHLYQGPLDGFVASRTALARTLAGDDAKRVKGLQKPAAAAWAVNQLYWHARAVYDRLIKSGAALRTAQVAALAGRKADVRGSADAHRGALAAAVKEALRLSASAGVNPNQDALTQTCEALSLCVKTEEPPGRLTKPLRPAGFEALAGVAVKAAPAKAEGGRERQRKEEAAAAERERQAEADLRSARSALERAQRAEARARSEWEDRKRDLDRAAQALADLEKR